LEIGIPNNILVRARVIKVDAERDLALLSILPNEALAPLNLSRSNPEIGERVTALLIDQDASMRVQIGTVVQVAMYVPSLGPSSDRIGVNLPVEPGASGTPVVDKEGRLLGLVQAVMGEITILIAAEETLAFVDGSIGVA
jgi:S1-C subfamily serine protease